MKKIFALLFGLAAASQVFAATTVCSVGTASTYAVTASMFVVQAFTPKCSANTYVSYEQNAVAVAVGSASSKGKSKFIGTSGGGSISGSACAAVTCVLNDATSQLTATLASAT